MDSSPGPPGYTNFQAQSYQQQTSQTLPPIFHLGLVPPGPQPTPRDPGRRSRARAQPYAEPANFAYNGQPVITYYIENLPYDMEGPSNEDYNVTFRQTFDGRTLKYTLTVLQQPERARACGAGARSSADRRPVDPPPVIELRVFEAQGQDSKEWTDITAKHNATFILCASLENARPIARGRLHTPTNIASLQGVNFAGTNYLERPKPAGYFIFPDLSVRNEGWYRLSFSLLEGTKEARDADPERQFPPSPRPQADGEPKEPLDFENMATRLDVRSRPFQVFSAKKFPGLSESTELSRLVADQGCRVRIRRDVRMRKHGARKDDGASYEGDRRSISRFQTPDTAYQPQTPMEQPRSISRTSMDRSQHTFDHYRRPSGEPSYYGHPYQTGSSPIAPYPAPPGSMSTPASTHSYPGYSQPPPAPIPPIAMQSNGFAVPQPRQSLENTSSSYPAAESRSFHALPNPAALPRSITPDCPKVSLPALSITNLTNPTNGSFSYDSSRRQWVIPNESGSSKRSYSPDGARTQSQPLKGGMRPDSLHNVTSYTSAGPMEADQFPYNSDSEDGFEESMSQTMKYKRANGTTGRKPVPVSFTKSQVDY
jgi:hypothetical protein